FLAEGLARMPGIKIDPAKVQTNIVVFEISGTGMTSAEFSRKLAESSVLMHGITPELVRLVTHMDVDRAACERALEAIRAICARK
ncbi:MAG TPA: low specificity L-threonine aldolase, partial [Terriglobales bacterium]|nr:low specificity L-threonine aldolase [Terriglobales bacterium]